jgi:Cdc6-like AAA superfamily ATPase
MKKLQVPLLPNISIAKIEDNISEPINEDIIPMQPQNYGSYFIHRPPTTSQHLIISDSFLIEKHLGCKWEDVFVIRIQEEIKALCSKLENISDTFQEREYFVVGNRWKNTSDFLFKIPNTDVVIINREYGFLFNKKYLEIVSNFLETISLSPSSYSESSLDKVYWNEKTLSLKNDILFFSRSKHWFDKRDLPYARSYLLYGPPGNGKTSVIRAISKFFKTGPSQFSFTAKYEDPDSAFLDWISAHESRYSSEYDAPENEYPRFSMNLKSMEEKPRVRVLVLEDIDRFFSKDEGAKTGVSFSTILNALDGVVQRKNSIVIATANNPEKIDSQVLFRPGRFDLRIPFESPSKEEVFLFLRKLSEEDDISDESIAKVADLTSGHSLAFIKGIYMAAANRAFSRSSQLINDDDILSSSSEFTNNMGKNIKTIRSGAGF